MPRFAVNLSWLFQERPFLERFGAARAAGFDAVEFRSPYEHPAGDIAARLDEHGQRCVLFNLPMGSRERGDFGIACRPGREAEFRAGVAQALEYVRALRVPRVNCIVGTIAQGEDREALRGTLIANLRYAARALGDDGVELVVEPVNSVDVPTFFAPRCTDMAALIAAVDQPNIGLQFDIYHAAMMGDDPFATFDALRAVIRHIQFADAPGRGEPGTGHIALDRLFRHIDASDYAGFVSAEYRPTCETLRTLGWHSATA